MLGVVTDLRAKAVHDAIAVCSRILERARWDTYNRRSGDHALVRAPWSAKEWWAGIEAQSYRQMVRDRNLGLGGLPRADRMARQR